MNGYDNWKMAFLPAALLAGWSILCGRIGGLAGAVAIGCLYGALIDDGCFFAPGLKSLNASVGSMASVLVWNFLGALAVAIPVAFFAPSLVPAAKLENPMALFLMALACGMLEAIAYRSGPALPRMAIGTLMQVAGLPHAIMALPAAIRTGDPGDGTLMMLLVIVGDLLGARLWASAHKAPKH